MSWYVVKTRVRQEERSVTHLENQELDVYCPWLRRKNGQREALFPGYIFVSLESFAESFATISSTRGVQKIVKFGEWWATMDDELIHLLMEKEHEHQCEPNFKPQQPVTFRDGPFKGMEAIYLYADGEKRAMVLLNLLSRRQNIRVEEQYLKAI